jgi:hypothetical protein
VLVFVSEWYDKSEFAHGKRLDPTDLVPPALYMPDGRIVPVCVVQAERDESVPVPVGNLTFPSTMTGGGYPVLVDVQGQEHVASIGCLVTDGHLTYALTNRHVAGSPGEPLYSMHNGQRVQIGVSSQNQLGRKAFQEIYARWPGNEVYVDLDIGLIEITDKSQWTAQIYGIGEMGNVVDVGPDGLALKLIGCPVKAYGCASREMYGSIAAFLYRYKSIGGFEYVADFLVGSRSLVRTAQDPRKAEKEKSTEHQAPALSTHPGDSGTLWLLETDDGRSPMPLAVQWGGHVYFDGDEASRLSFALATSLTTVCNELNVDIIRDWNVGMPEYWGAVGHYTIAGKAIDLLKDGDLKSWMGANRDLITYPTEDVVDKNMKGLSNRPYVPLADVPDMVWKVGPHKRGGMKSPEHSNHFADMDQPRPGDKKTLLDLCEENMDLYATLPQWQAYYTAVQDESRGLLPFRVWQIWDAMANAKDIESFICAAGIVAHYVGDSCQPLHISFRFNGDPLRPVPTQVKDPKTKQWVEKDLPAGTGVHSAYEDNMVNHHIDDINQGLAKARANSSWLRDVTSGSDAAKAVIDLMQHTFGAIQPLDIVNVYIEAQKKLVPRQMADVLWNKFGDDTIDVMTLGSQALAHIWQTAWDANDHFEPGKASALSQKSMINLYTDPEFLPSHTLDTIESVLEGAHATAPLSGNVRENPSHPKSNGQPKSKAKRRKSAKAK